jgi:hypothetical protein
MRMLLKKRKQTGLRKNGVKQRKILKRVKKLGLNNKLGYILRLIVRLFSL